MHTKSDADGVDQTLKAMGEIDRGLIFTNLVDFDTLYGHRNDVAGLRRATWSCWTRACRRSWPRCATDDVFLLTADHGCDPSDVSTDHTRENVPLLVRGPRVPAGTDLGLRSTLRRPRRRPWPTTSGVGPLAAGDVVPGRALPAPSGPEVLDKSSAKSIESAV